MNYLIQLSGGIDSFAAALSILKKHDTNKATLLHVLIKDANLLYRAAQLAAVRDQFEYIFKMFPYRVRLSIDEYKTSAAGYQDVIWYQIASALHVSAAGSMYNAIVNGTTLSDCRSYGVAWPSVGCDIGEGKHLAEDLFKVLASVRNIPESLYLRPLNQTTKAEAYALLPENVCTWSCECPQLKENYFRACGQCNSCREYQREGLKHSMISKELVDDNSYFE